MEFNINFFEHKTAMDTCLWKLSWEKIQKTNLYLCSNFIKNLKELNE